MHAFSLRRVAPLILMPLLLAGAMLAAGTGQLMPGAAPHPAGVAACPLSTNWDAVTATCR
jgi:hypothetical protein